MGNYPPNNYPPVNGLDSSSGIPMEEGPSRMYVVWGPKKLLKAPSHSYSISYTQNPVLII